MLVCDILVVMIFVFMISLNYNELRRSKLATAAKFAKANLDRNAREYLLSIKGASEVAPYGYMVGFIVSAFMFLILKISKNIINISDSTIYLLTIITFVLSFGTSYKLFGCFLARSICMEDCGIFDKNIE